MSQILRRAVHEWQSGKHYEAHETLEDFAQEVEDDDHDWQRALALCHIAAAIHKHLNNVTPSAVPGKLESALRQLQSAPPFWFGLDIASLRRDAASMLDSLKRSESPKVLPQLKFYRRA